MLDLHISLVLSHVINENSDDVVPFLEGSSGELVRLIRCSDDVEVIGRVAECRSKIDVVEPNATSEGCNISISI
jgi:hypothetical protein